MASRSPLPIRGELVLVAAALYGRSALASPLDDVRAGDTVRLNESYVAIDGGGVVGLSDAVIPKAVGTLDLTLSARAFGIDTDDTFVLTGTADGDLLTWTFAETLDAPYEVPETAWTIDPVRIQTLTGTIVVRASYLRGEVDARCGAMVCPYDVALDLVESRIHLHGNHGPAPFEFSWDNDAHFGALHLYGGLPRPLLASLDLDLPERLCTSPEVRVLTGTVHLQSPAVGRGTWVDLLSSSSDAIPNARVAVAPGRDSARFGVFLLDHYQGPLTLWAASGGVLAALDTEIEGPKICLSSDLDSGELVARPWLDASVFPCPTCVTRAVRNARGDTAAIVDGELITVDPDGLATRWASDFGGLEARTVHLNVWGSVAGTAVDKGGEESSFLIVDGEAWFVKDFHASAISARDVAIGEKGGQLATFADGVLTSDSGTAVAGVVGIDTRNHVAYEYLDPKQTPQVAWRDGKSVHELGSLGGAVVARDMSSFGAIVGSATDDGVQRPFVYTPEEGKLTALDLPAGFVRGEAVSVNAIGWVVGNAYGPKGEPGPFFYAPGDGTRLLQPLVKDSLTIEEAVQITDSGEIAVWARDAGGALGLYLLTTP